MSAVREMQVDEFELPLELVSTDRILSRWAISVGLGLPTAEFNDDPHAKPPPLDDGTAMTVDRVYCTSPPRTQEFLRLWYRTPQPRSVIARRLKMHTDTVKKARIVILGYVRWRFEGTGYPDLISLVRTRIA